MSFVKRKFNAMLGVATVAMAVNFIVMLTGSVVAGNLLGKEGLAGVNVCTPVFAVASFLGALVSVGSGLVFSRAMGEFDERRAAGVWTQSVLVAAALGAAIFLVMHFSGGAFFDFNGITGAIRDEAASYWRWQSVSMGLTPLVLLLLAMVYADGDGAVALLAGGCYVAGTAGFSSLFALRTGHAGGISGGTALTMVLVIAAASLHLLRKHNHLRFVRYFSGRDLARTFAGSVPDATIYLCWGLLVLVVNLFTVSAFGEELLAVVALGVSVVEFSIVFDGVGEALIPLGGMYAGEGNRPALRELARHSALVATGEGILAGIVLFALAEPIASMYGFRGEAAGLLPQAVSMLRWLALALPFMGLLMMVNTHFLVIGHLGLAVAVTVLKDFFLPALSALALGHCFGFRGLWAGFLLGYVFAAAFPFLYVLSRYGRARFPWLVERVATEDDFSVRLTESALAPAIERIGCRLRTRGVREDIVDRVLRTVETNARATIAANRPGRVLAEYFLTVEADGGVRLVIRDDGVRLETPFAGLSSGHRYLNTLGCNRAEHRFGRNFQESEVGR